MLLFFDIETTGLPKNFEIDPVKKWPRIVQLAWSLYDKEGTRQSRNSFIIYPTDFSIPMDTARIHGITTERARAEGTSLYKVLPQFNADVMKATRIIAHNRDYDLPIVDTEFSRCKIETGLLKKEQCCTMKPRGGCGVLQTAGKVGPGIQVADLKRAAHAVVRRGIC